LQQALPLEFRNKWVDKGAGSRSLGTSKNKKVAALAASKARADVLP
jgi:hypothetical protein